MQSKSVNSLSRHLQQQKTRITTSSLFKMGDIQQEINNIKNPYKPHEKIIKEFQDEIEQLANQLNQDDDIFLKSLSSDEIEEILVEHNVFEPGDISDVKDFLTNGTTKLLLKDEILNIFIKSKSENQSKPTYKLLFSIDTSKVNKNNITQSIKLLNGIIEKINHKIHNVLSLIDKSDLKAHTKLRQNIKLLHDIEVKTIRFMQKIAQAKEFKKQSNLYVSKVNEKDKNINKNKAKTTFLQKIFGKKVNHQKPTIMDDIHTISKKVKIDNQKEQNFADAKDSINKLNLNSSIRNDVSGNKQHNVINDNVISFGVNIKIPSDDNTSHEKSNNANVKQDKNINEKIEQQNIDVKIQTDQLVDNVKMQVQSKIEHENIKKQNEIQQDVLNQQYNNQQQKAQQIDGIIKEKSQNGAFDTLDVSSQEGESVIPTKGQSLGI